MSTKAQILYSLATSGIPSLAGGKLYHYEAGTSTDKDVYLDRDKLVPAAQPVVLDSNGRANIYGDGIYKFVLKDSDDNIVNTFDNSTLSEDGVDALTAINNGDLSLISTGSVTSRSLKSRFSDVANILDYGAVSNGTTDCTSAIQLAIDTGKMVYIPAGLYLIDPSVGLRMREGTHMFGDGLKLSGFLAKYDTAGSVIRRDFSPGVSNDYVNDVYLHDFAIFLNHVYQSTVPTNIQIGFNMRDISRSVIQRCYSGNYKWGTAATLYPNGTKTEGMRGYGFFYGTRSASDPDYCGGEVHSNISCKAYWLRKGITLDDTDLTGGVSAAYATKIYDADIQTIERGITQESQYNTGCVFQGNTIQETLQASGGTDSRHIYLIRGYENRVVGGYVEVTDANIDYLIELGTAATNNIIEPFYYSNADAKFLNDLSGATRHNIIRYYRSSDDSYHELENGVEYLPARVKAYAVFDNSATPVVHASHNISSVTKTAAGDYQVNWDTSTALGIGDDSLIQCNVISNASAHAFSCYLRSHSGTNTRINSYNHDQGTLADAARYYVMVLG